MFGFFKTRSHVTTEDESAPSQAEIDREIAQLKEDSARDVQRQLEQQHLAEKEEKIKEEVKKVEEEVKDKFGSARLRAKEQATSGVD